MSMMLSRLLIAALILLPPAQATALGAPEPDLWPRWTAHDPMSRQTVDHAAWGVFLKKYLSVQKPGANLVAYGRVSAADKKGLKTYIQSLAEVPVSKLTRGEQLAFWVNLYNALTVDVVLDHYPTDSIMDIDISPGFFSNGPWGKKLVAIEGEAVSLNDIEHRILRPIWKDPRIHYAVNCASLGCPDLQPKPFTGNAADAMLTAAARSFIASDRAVWPAEGDTVGASSIYKWFSEDFGNSAKAILNHMLEFAGPAQRQWLGKARDISTYHYDWSLNEAKKVLP
jgi:hypothetical protein